MCRLLALYHLFSLTVAAPSPVSLMAENIKLRITLSPLEQFATILGSYNDPVFAQPPPRSIVLLDAEPASIIAENTELRYRLLRLQYALQLAKEWDMKGEHFDVEKELEVLVKRLKRFDSAI